VLLKYAKERYKTTMVQERKALISFLNNKAGKNDRTILIMDIRVSIERKKSISVIGLGINISVL
jgi:hypothetical protein